MKKNNNLTKLSNAIGPKTENKQLKDIVARISSKFKFEKIICFGSQVNTAQKESCFASDDTYNVTISTLNGYWLLLIPSKDEQCADIKIQQRLESEFKSTASVTIIVHRMAECNTALENGSSFFTCVYKNGSILYDNKMEFFVSPREGKPLSKRIIQKEEFWNHWYKLSNSFVKGGQFFADGADNEIAIFMCHQALQHCYSAMIRVLTGYRTDSHSLHRLLKLIENALPDYSFVSPDKSTPEESRLTGLLLKGFSDARYNNSFLVSTEEVISILIKINSILKNANQICLEKIKSLKDANCANAI